MTSIMNRRGFLRTTLAAGAAAGVGRRLAGAPAIVSSEAAKHRPNILFVFTDQQQAFGMSCAGMAGVATPAMDALAARGVRFARTYSFQPLCTPSRTSILTGRPPRVFGTRVNNLTPRVPDGTPTVGRLLADAGYDTAYVGKWHVPLAATNSALHGFATMRDISDGGPHDKDVAAPCAQILRAQRTKPLFLVASIIDPHDICEFARDEELFNGDIPDTPPARDCPPLPANHALLPDEPEAIAHAKQVAPHIYPTDGWTADHWRQYGWGYRRLIEKADGYVGQVVDALAASGRLDDTLVIFASDHGDGGGSHCWNQKSILYEESVRVPLIAAGPGVNGRDRVDDEHLVSLGLDFLPTLCDVAGARCPAGLAGRSLRPLFAGQDNLPWRDHLIAETEFSKNKGIDPSGIKGRMVRTDQFKYTIYSEGRNREQFFDLTADPGETKNLAASGPHAAELARHRALLKTWAAGTRDDFPYAV